jgi:hypothetical protein
MLVIVQKEQQKQTFLSFLIDIKQEIAQIPAKTAGVFKGCLTQKPIFRIIKSGWSL